MNSLQFRELGLAVDAKTFPGMFQHVGLNNDAVLNRFGDDISEIVFLLCISACAVPSCGSCLTQVTAQSSNAFGTAPPPWRYTPQIFVGLSKSAASRTCPSSGFPASLCSTLGSVEYMRLP